LRAGYSRKRKPRHLALCDMALPPTEDRDAPARIAIMHFDILTSR